MVDADVIVLSTPVYFYTMDGQLKTFIDRCVPRYTEISNKDFYFIVSAADTNKNNLAPTVEGLRGALLPGSQDGYLDTWFRPTDDAVFDDALLGVIQQSLGAPNEQIIALSALEQNERGDTFLRASVIVERGLMPETPEEFCAASNRLLDDVWAALAPQVSDGAESSLYLHIYVAENDSVTHNGKPSTFAELREAAQTDVMSLDSYSFVVALGSYPSCSLWPDSTELIRYDCDPYQVDGTIARSREWRYDSDTE